MNLSRPFIQLPYCFDADRLAEEVASLPESAWMEHPSRMRGNSAAALISRNGGDNDDFDGRMLATPHLERCPYTAQAMASFNEVLTRSRFMRLAPGAEVQLHVDFNYHWYTRVRIHIPVVTEPEVIFYCADRKLHMQAGECWIFNSWRRHRVVNGGSRDRVHLVIDTAGSSRFWDMVRGAEAGPVDPVFVAFDPDARPDVLTERFNTAPVMAPGEVDALVASLVSDFSKHPGNDPQLIAEYSRLLENFCKDWRDAWHRYGYEPEGHERYRELIENVRAGMHANPRALLTHSNEIGVNPIIVQRILRPALSPQHLDQFTAGNSSG